MNMVNTSSAGEQYCSWPQINHAGFIGQAEGFCPQPLYTRRPHNPCQTTCLHRRFDRELVFPLPNLQARASILDIHTRKWSQPPAADLKEDLAHRCVGYCGADLKVNHRSNLTCVAFLVLGPLRA